MKQLVIIGASGHGKVVADIAKKNGYNEIIFLDDNSELNSCGQYKVVGNFDDVYKYSSDVFVAIGNHDIRKQMIESLEKSNYKLTTLIHPNAIVSTDVHIGDGTVVMPGAVINAGTKIGKGCIVNTSSSIDHDCTIGDYVHVSVGSHLAGTVVVGNNTWIGVGAIVSNNVTITEKCLLGAGAVVVKDITVPGVYTGIPARIRVE